MAELRIVPLGGLGEVGKNISTHSDDGSPSFSEPLFVELYPLFVRDIEAGGKLIHSGRARDVHEMNGSDTRGSFNALQGLALDDRQG